MIVFYCFLGLAAIVLCAAYAVFRIIFRSPNKWQNDDLNIPHSDQTYSLR
jgi:hypothetical protein